MVISLFIIIIIIYKNPQEYLILICPHKISILLSSVFSLLAEAVLHPLLWIIPHLTNNQSFVTKTIKMRILVQVHNDNSSSHELFCFPLFNGLSTIVRYSMPKLFNI